MKDDALQLLDPILQLDLPVFIDEELGIRETGCEHALIAFPDQLRVAAFHVGHRNESREQCPVLPHQ